MTSKREEILSTLKEDQIKFFTISEISSIFGLSKNYSSQIVYQLKNDGKVAEIEKGKYVLSDWDDSPLFIAYKSIQPSYISFKTALCEYDLNNEPCEVIYIATPKRKNNLDFKTYNFKYIKFKPYKFFGFHPTEVNGSRIIMADPEKAIIDCLGLLNYGPEIKKFTRILRDSLKIISMDKLISFAKRFKDKSLVSRLGYLLEKINVKIRIASRYLPKDFIKLNPSGERRGKWISRWNIIDNL